MLSGGGNGGVDARFRRPMRSDRVVVERNCVVDGRLGADQPHQNTKSRRCAHANLETTMSAYSGEDGAACRLSRVRP